MNSSRFPGKALAPVAGKPLLSRLIDHLSPLSEMGPIVVATTGKRGDDLIADLAASKGVSCFRGDEDDALSRFITAAAEFGIDEVVRITGDNPLTDPGHIKAALHCLYEEHADYVGVAGLPVGIGGEVCTVDSLKQAHELTDEPIHRESITSYLYTNPDRFKIRMLDRSGLPYSRPSYRLTVDTPEDLQLLDAIFRILGDTPALSDVVDLLDSRPELAAINGHVVQRSPFF